MSHDNLDILGDCIKSLNNSNQSLQKIIRNQDNVLKSASSSTDNSEINEYKRLKKIIKCKKVYRIYSLNNINLQISKYNDIKNKKIVTLLEIFEKLINLKLKEKEILMNRVELLQDKLEQFVNYQNLNLSNVDSGAILQKDEIVDSITPKERREIENLDEEINNYKFQISKIQLRKIKLK